MLDFERQKISDYTIIKNLSHNSRYDLRILGNPDGETRFQKVAKSFEAGQQLEAEYNFYSFLQKTRNGVFVVPHIYDYEPYKSILLEDVKGSTFQAAEISAFIHQLIEILKYLYSVGTRPEAPINPYFKGLKPGNFFYKQAREAVLETSMTMEARIAFLASIEDCVPITGRFGHGDFQPSNIMHSDGNLLYVIDGEGAGSNLLPFADVAHLYYQLRVAARPVEAQAWLKAAQTEWSSDPDFSRCVIGYLSWITIMDQKRLDLVGDNAKAILLHELAGDISKNIIL